MGAERRGERQTKGVSMEQRTKPWLPPLPVGLCVQVGNFTAVASKSLGQKGSGILDSVGTHSNGDGTDGLCGVSSDTPSSHLGLCLSPWDSRAVAALWQCHMQGGDARLSQQLGCLSEPGKTQQQQQ